MATKKILTDIVSNGNIQSTSLTVTGDVIVDTDIYTSENTVKLMAGGTGGTYIEINDTASLVELNADIQTDSFIKNGGSSSEFLKADGSVDTSTYVPTSTLSSYIRSDVNDIFTGRLTGSQLWLGGGVITGQGLSAAKLQVNGIQRTGDIYLHELSSGVPTSSSVQLRNNSGDLEWDGDTVYHTGNLSISGSNTGDQDLSSFLTASSTQSKYLRSDGDDTSSGMITARRFYISSVTAPTQWAFQSRNSANTADSGLYFDTGHGNLLLRDSSNNLNVRLRGGGGDSYFLGNLAIGTTTATSGLSSGRILKVSSNGNSEVNLDHTDGGTGSDIGLFSFSRNGDHLAHMKASHDGSTTAAFLSFHTQASGGGYDSPQSNEQMRITSIGRVGMGVTNPQGQLHVSSGSQSETTLIVGASGTSNNVSSRIILNEGEAGFTDSKDYGFSLAYDGAGSTYGLPANTFGIIRHDNSATGAHALTIQRSNGNVGIGTDSPDAKVDIISGTNNGLRISATDTNNNWRDITIRSYTSEAEADALPAGVHMFTTNPSSATGNVFSKYGGFVIQCRDDGNSSFGIRVGSGLTEAFFINNNAAATFSSTVTATNFILSSDKRLKENIKKVDNKHIDVDWKTFEMKSDKGQSRYGVIAQELEEVHPEFVRTDEQGMKSVAYIDLLIAKIAELEARLDKANI